MNKILKAIGKKIGDHFRRTWRNKLIALVLVVLSSIVGLITGDYTALAFMAVIIGIPLWFLKEDIFEEIES